MVAVLWEAELFLSSDSVERRGWIGDGRCASCPTFGVGSDERREFVSTFCGWYDEGCGWSGGLIVPLDTGLVWYLGPRGFHRYVEGGGGPVTVIPRPTVFVHQSNHR